MINEASYNSEKELEDVVFSRIGEFLPGSKLMKGFQVRTVSGKNGTPDGFAFDFENGEWYVVECELLLHGVWPHIAEQITRFVVAVKNPDTLRKIRDRVFDHLLDECLTDTVCAALESTRERLYQQIELFIESVQPTLVIFIDESSQDLEDMIQALNVPAQVFRIKKFIVNGKPEYYSPDKDEPVAQTEPPDKDSEAVYDVIGLLGGGKIEATLGRFKCYRLDDDSVVYVKKSKYHERNDYYWYGIAPQSLEHIRENNVNYIVFVMGDFGFVKVPIDIVLEYLKTTGVTKQKDGSVRHYHIIISHGPEPELYYSNDRPKFALAGCFEAFE
jgi:hypothetical protein